MPDRPGFFSLTPAKIAGGYLLFGGLWILLSDRVVTAVATNQAQISLLQTAKGWLFVLVSGAIFFGLIRAREQRLSASQEHLVQASQELQVLHRLFRHNARNDLNVVRGYVEMAIDEADDSTEVAYLERALEATGRILDTSEKLRLIERTNVQTEADRPIDLRPIIDDECERLRADHPAVTIDTDLPDDLRVRGHGELTYVFREVLENAVQHHNGQAAECHIDIAAERTGESTRVEIADNGPGIPQGELESLQAGEESALSHVSGVGLWLITWLCQWAGGTARFDSSDGRGTRVTLEFEPASA